MEIEPIGTVRVIDDDRSRIELAPAHAEGLDGMEVGDEVDILYWMHELGDESRRTMRVHPRGDAARPRKGVFALRSPMRPNPIGVSRVRVVDVDGGGLAVSGLDAHDGSPVIDVKAARRSVEVERLIDMWGRVHNAMIAALEQSVGREGLERALREPMRRAGGEAAGAGRRTTAEIGRAIMDIERLWGIEGRVVADTPDCFRREVSACPWSYFGALGCEVFAWWMEGFVAASSDACSYRLEKSIPRGDDVCVWSVRCKASRRTTSSA